MHVKAEDIAEYSGAVKNVGPITVATYQILVWRADREQAFPHFKLFRERHWGLIIYDEVHLLPAPVFRVTAITHRHNPIFHALLPASLEHKNLMGMPREPTIFAAVNAVVRCTGVTITPGGCSWLHAVVQIEKSGPDDGLRAIDAARSCSPRTELDIAADIEVRKQGRLLENITDVSLVHGQANLVCTPPTPGDASQQRGLAGTRLAEDSCDSRVRNFGVNIENEIAFRQLVSQADHRESHLRLKAYMPNNTTNANASNSKDILCAAA